MIISQINHRIGSRIYYYRKMTEKPPATKEPIRPKVDACKAKAKAKQRNDLPPMNSGVLPGVTGDPATSSKAAQPGLAVTPAGRVAPPPASKEHTAASLLAKSKYQLSETAQDTLPASLLGRLSEPGRESSQGSGATQSQATQGPTNSTQPPKQGAVATTTVTAKNQTSKTAKNGSTGKTSASRTNSVEKDASSSKKEAASAAVEKTPQKDQKTVSEQNKNAAEKPETKEAGEKPNSQTHAVDSKKNGQTSQENTAGNMKTEMKDNETETKKNKAEVSCSATSSSQRPRSSSQLSNEPTSSQGPKTPAANKTPGGAATPKSAKPATPGFGKASPAASAIQAAKEGESDSEELKVPELTSPASLMGGSPQQSKKGGVNGAENESNPAGSSTSHGKTSGKAPGGNLKNDKPGKIQEEGGKGADPILSTTNEIDAEKEAVRQARARLAAQERQLKKEAEASKKPAGQKRGRKKRDLSAENQEIENLTMKFRQQLIQERQQKQNSQTNRDEKSKKTEAPGRQSKTESTKTPTPPDDLPSDDNSDESSDETDLPELHQSNQDKLPSKKPPPASMPGDSKNRKRKGTSGEESQKDPCRRVAGEGKDPEQEQCTAAELKEIEQEKNNNSTKPADFSILGHSPKTDLGYLKYMWQPVRIYIKELPHGKDKDINCLITRAITRNILAVVHDKELYLIYGRAVSTTTGELCPTSETVEWFTKAALPKLRLDLINETTRNAARNLELASHASRAGRTVNQENVELHWQNMLPGDPEEDADDIRLAALYAVVSCLASRCSPKVLERKIHLANLRTKNNAWRKKLDKAEIEIIDEDQAGDKFRKHPAISTHQLTATCDSLAVQAHQVTALDNLAGDNHLSDFDKVLAELSMKKIAKSL